MIVRHYIYFSSAKVGVQSCKLRSVMNDFIWLLYINIYIYICMYTQYIYWYTNMCRHIDAHVLWLLQHATNKLGRGLVSTSRGAHASVRSLCLCQWIFMYSNVILGTCFPRVFQRCLSNVSKISISRGPYPAGGWKEAKKLWVSKILIIVRGGATTRFLTIL